MAIMEPRIAIIAAIVITVIIAVWRQRVVNKRNIEPEPEEEIEEEQPDYFAEKDDIRADIDTAIAVYNLLGEMDMDSTDILTWRMRNKLRRAKKQCLEMICESVKSLSPEEEEKEES
jgi:hypothetical protein